jgi:putative protease
VTGTPEILAPAGDAEALEAALAAGADAVYFGLSEGFNARARAAGFSLASLAATVARVHRAGARAYLTLNTLVFESELARVEEIVQAAAGAGIDALIVQDPAVALIARRVCPGLELHASTQMTISSPEAAGFARTLGISRVVLPRELSLAEIRAMAAGCDLELEVFVHGALCVSWSGQCLTSEAWGGRSANRGQCAQACRLPYELEVDGERRDLGDVQYLLSPRDLAGAHAVAALAEAGVACLKIEGRYKGAEYVASAVHTYRGLGRGELAGAAAIDEALARLALCYSRGFSRGFLEGSDHQTLVEGRFPRHRGLYLGRVLEVSGDRVLVARDGERRPWTGALGLQAERPAGPQGPLAAPLGAPPAEVDAVMPRPGMGVVFDAGRAEEDNSEPGGPIFAVASHPRGVWLGFGRPGPDLGRVAPGDRVWLSGDPALGRQLRQLLRAGAGTTGHPLDLEIRGRAGRPLEVRVRWAGRPVELQSTVTLAPASGAGLDEPLLRGKLGAFGGTPFHLRGLDVSGLAPGLHLPVSQLKELRRALVSALEAALAAPPARAVHGGAVTALRGDAGDAGVPAPGAAPGQAGSSAGAAYGHRSGGSTAEEPTVLVPLCRSEAQLAAVIAASLPEVELDWMEMVGLGRAVEQARRAGLRVTIATTRVQKPGEQGYDQRIARLAPDAVLVRHWGAVMHFRALEAARRPVLHGDFSLNVTNSITLRHLLALGLDTITCAHDLDRSQLGHLLERAPAAHLAVTVHHHIPTFHTEHCVYAHTLSAGRDYRSCGRPCEQHSLSLRDRRGLSHPVIVDVGCRNTVFNAQAQSAAGPVPELVRRGVRRLRLEFVRESGEETARVIAAYQALVAGRMSPAEVIGAVGVHEQFGVTRGTMRVLS